MPNVTKGNSMAGLLVYLAGPGRHNDHVNPHVVAGDPTLMAWRKESALDRAGAFAVARHLERPRQAFGVESVAQGSVWHCSLAIEADEGQLDDETWAAIARDFADAMGFTSAATPCRWVTVRHGTSINGHDHIHFVATRVADNGSVSNVYRDWKRVQEIAGQLERRYGLVVLESRTAKRGDRGYKPSEKAHADRAGAPEVDRVRLERTVRACAAASADEAEFVRRVRRAGVRIRPRFATGRTDVVTGYSVALRARQGEQPVWYGGGRLAKDLTLTRLRADWPDSPAHASAAVDEWQAAHRARRAVASGREASEPDRELWERCAAELVELRERLRAVPADDRSTWAHVAREAAGAFAAWSLEVEPTPGPLAATAAALARSAQLPAHEVRRRPPGLPSARLVASLAFGRGMSLEAVVLRELVNLVKALHDAHQAIGEAQRASEIAAAVRTQVATVTAGLPVAGRPAGTGTDRAGGHLADGPGDTTIER